MRLYPAETRTVVYAVTSTRLTRYVVMLSSDANHFRMLQIQLVELQKVLKITSL